jgi:hypothetical protein
MATHTLRYVPNCLAYLIDSTKLDGPVAVKNRGPGFECEEHTWKQCESNNFVCQTAGKKTLHSSFKNKNIYCLCIAPFTYMKIEFPVVRHNLGWTTKTEAFLIGSHNPNWVSRTMLYVGEYFFSFKGTRVFFPGCRQTNVMCDLKSDYIRYHLMPERRT